MSSSNKWDNRFYQIAVNVKEWSKDPSTKVGAVIVDEKRNLIIATGYNGFASGIADLSERFEDREGYKYPFIVHAEVNAILNAAKNGAKTNGCTIYTTFPPCTQCAAAIIQAGITRVVGPSLEEVPRRWYDAMIAAIGHLNEAKVTYENI